MIRGRRLSPRRRRSARALDGLVATLVLIALVALAAYLTREEEVIAGLASAIDGDSVRILDADIRLEGIDAPELAQTCHAGGRTYGCGEVARRTLAEIVRSGIVTCRIEGRDRYRRRLGRCDIAGDDIGAGLVRRGVALAFGRYQDEEAAARSAKLGVWAGTFELPSEWRRAHAPE